MATLASFLGVEQPTKLVRNKATYHKNIIEVWTPKSPYTKLQDGWEPTEVKQGRTTRGNSVFQDENNDRSIRRTKRIIKNLAINNEFQLWVTLTMGKDRQDDKKSYTKLENWLKSEKRRVGKFDYLIVPERHKDGAIHFHALIGSYQGELIKAINQKTGKLHKNKKGKQTYHFKTYKHGLHTVEYIDDQERIATYITKYITKDMQTTTFNKKRYWANRTLKQPEVEENPQWLAGASQPQKTIELEQGTLSFYSPTARK